LGSVSKRRRSDRFGKGVPLSAVTVGKRRGRYHRRRRVRRVLCALVLLAALGVVAIVATGAGAGGPVAATTTQGRPATDPAPANRAAWRDASTGRDRRDAPAINAALAYTPFVAHGVPRRRVIALTFDDGPSPYTPQVIRVLVRMHVPATFFVVGQQLTYFAGTLRDELRYGFGIGDHTENHAWLIRLTPALQYAQIHDAALAVSRLGASFPRLFRPPYGAYDARTIAVLRRLKMLMVMWSIDPGDWRRPGVKAIVSSVLANARPGAIVIMHDGGGDRSQTVAALPAIIKGLRRRHYQLVSVPRLLTVDPPPRHQRLPHLYGV
jgi:peptidoglycan/xylan/chitin deacetylase (PgdA/CDA1 family)